MSHLQHLIAIRAAQASASARSKRLLAKAGVIGAGLMGGGIAHVCARAGLEVTLIDTSIDAAEKGKARIIQRERDAVARGFRPVGSEDELAARLSAGADFKALADAEIVIEAVFEDRAIKAEVTRKAEAAMSAGAILATNTSTLPITGLAEASRRPEQFIGLHFFSPVDRMPLLEIIRGRLTSDGTHLAALDFAEQIGKTPISVNDARGFYTTRIIIAYINEANEMLAEGIAPDLIDAAAVELGMPLGPLALCDEVALSLMHRINEQARLDLGPAYRETAGARFLARMVEIEKRGGRRAGRGYYNYPTGAPKQIWPGLRSIMPSRAEQPPGEVIRDRLVAIQVLEAVRALEQGVLTSPLDGDIGAILGWGMPESIGGPFTYIDRVGLRDFTATCVSLASLGERFALPDILRDRARLGLGFHGADS